MTNHLSSPNISLETLDRDTLWHPFSQMSEYEPLIIQRADGVWLESVDGRRYIDGVSSMWCNVHGHNHPYINDAIIRQLKEVAHVTLLGMSHPTTIRLAEKLVEITPPGLTKVFFSSDGASAVEVGLKMAFQYWRQIDCPQPNRNTFLAAANAYHGDTLGSVSVGGIARFHAMFSPLLFPVIRGPAPDRDNLPAHIDANLAAEYYLKHYRDLLELHQDSVAGIIIEPIVQGAAGMVMHPAGFLKGLRDLADEFGTLLIADEVATGFGRTGTLFACQQEEVTPDIMCLGKGITGGYLALSATLATDRIWNAFLGNHSQSRSLFHGHTYAGNPLAAAAALATIELFEKEKTLNHVAEMSEKLHSVLSPLHDHPHVGNIRQTGLIAAVELVADKSNQTPFPWAERRGNIACQGAMEHNVWLRPLGNTIPVMPPLCITDQEIEHIGRAIQYGIRAATEKG